MVSIDTAQYDFFLPLPSEICVSINMDFISSKDASFSSSSSSFFVSSAAPPLPSFISPLVFVIVLVLIWFGFFVPCDTPSLRGGESLNVFYLFLGCCCSFSTLIFYGLEIEGRTSKRFRRLPIIFRARIFIRHFIRHLFFIRHFIRHFFLFGIFFYWHFIRQLGILLGNLSFFY